MALQVPRMVETISSDFLLRDAPGDGQLLVFCFFALISDP
jgi:hypothetical protein